MRNVQPTVQPHPGASLFAEASGKKYLDIKKRKKRKELFILAPVERPQTWEVIYLLTAKKINRKRLRQQPAAYTPSQFDVLLFLYD